MPKIQAKKIINNLRCCPRSFENDSMEERSKKLVIVGDAGCGKTSLLSVLRKGKTLENSHYVPTIYDSDGFVHVDVSLHESYIKIGSCFRIGPLKNYVRVRLNFFDTSGQEDLDRFRRLSYPDADVVLVCFSIDDPLSFHDVIERWVPEVRHFCNKVPIILVATKNDLRDSFETTKLLKRFKQHMINQEEIRRMAKSIGAFDYFECSAKTGQNIKEIFYSASRAALAKNRINRNTNCFP